MMLMQELNHRVKNALAVVQALASQTLASSTSLEEFGTAFEGRLSAYARCHGLLLGHEWTSANLMELVRDATQAVDSGRVTAKGPDIEIPPRKALSIYLVLHELLTNASKYGALSKDGGSVAVDWHRKNKNIIRLVWRERGGPPVTPPEHKGYGSTLVQQIAEYELDGDCDLQFDPEGLRCQLTFPFD
jgi:two-component system CheB/CheR fusion protein